MPALSPAEAIGALAKVAIDALALTDGTPAAAVTVAVLKVPALPSGKQPAQISLVVTEESTRPMTAIKKRVSYTLVVVIARAGGHKLIDDPVTREWRKLIAQELDDNDRSAFAGLPAGSAINRCNAAPVPDAFNAGALNKDIQWSALAFTVETIELRAT